VSKAGKPRAFSQPQNAPISAKSKGDNVILPAVAGVDYRILTYCLVADAAVSATWQDGSGGTARALSGPMKIMGNQTVHPAPLSDDTQSILGPTTVGNAVTLKLSAATQVSGHLTYATGP
jgi:hypothetical protein